MLTSLLCHTLRKFCPKGQLTSKRFRLIFSVTFSYFFFQFLPSPLHPTGFSFWFFPGFLVICTLLQSNNNNILCHTLRKFARRTLRALSTLRGLRGAPEVPPLCRETSVSRTANVGTVGKSAKTTRGNCSFQP